MDHELALALINAHSYRDFIKSYYDICKKRSAHFSYGTMAKKAALSSKSFIRDVASGSKRITSRSLPGIVKALDLSGQSAKYFKLLVIQEETDLNFDRLKEKEIKGQIEKLRGSLLHRLTPTLVTTSPSIYKAPLFPWVYAALGTPEKGATKKEIMGRTGISERDCLKILNGMESNGLVLYDRKKGRYYCQDLHLIFEQIGKDEFFQNFFLESLILAKGQAQTNFTSPQKLFMNSVFSIKRSHLPDLKIKLRNLLTDFIDDAENSEGDTVANLSISLFDLK